MFKRILGAASVVAALFACSSDDSGPGNSQPGDSSSSGCETEAPCGKEVKLGMNTANNNITAFGSYAFQYVDKGATIENEKESGPRPDGSTWEGYKNPVKEDGKNTYPLLNFDATADGAAVGIGIGVKGDGVEGTVKVSLDTLRYFKYEYKGVEHEFRMQKEEGVFWMQVFEATDEWKIALIDIEDETEFYDGTGGDLGPYDPSAVTQIQWVPTEKTGNLFITNFRGYSK